MKKIAPIALGFLATFAIMSGCFELGKAHAADSVIVDAGVGSAVSQAAPPPAATLHDPVAQPAAAWDDVKAARKVGWPVLVFAVLVMLSKLASRSGKWLSVLGRGKVAVIIGALGAIGASCYNAAADGGAWSATLLAGLVALAHYVDASPKQA